MALDDRAAEPTLPDVPEAPRVESAALRRLIEEVRSGDRVGDATAYNRVYHRHNR